VLPVYENILAARNADRAQDFFQVEADIIRSNLIQASLQAIDRKC
jgi:hypothetical protein